MTNANETPSTAPSSPPKMPRRRRALYSALCVGVVAAGLIGVLATRSVAPQTTVSTSLIGRLAPSINGPTILGNGTVNLQSFRGRYVVIAFFASWCAPCTDEVPQLDSFLFNHRNANDVAVIGVDIDDSTANGGAFLQRTGANFPAIEDSGLISEHYGVDEPPQAFLISPSGHVVDQVLSGVTANELDSLITAQQSGLTR